MIDKTFILRAAVAIILLTHSIPTMLDGSIRAFGEDYLNQVGFAPVGVPLAWAIKLSHVVAAVLLVINRYIKPAAMVTILILFTGIVMIHFDEGWFVIGRGRNGMEYNFLLICALVYIMFPNGFRKKKKVV